MGYGRHTDHPRQYSDLFSPNADQGVFDVLWELKKKGLKEQTVKNNGKLLKFLGRNVDLSKPDDVKAFLAGLERNDSYKRNLSLAYNNYAKVRGILWDKPRYFASSRMPQIPSEEKISMIIANCPKKLALAVSLSRDTGMRPVEVMGLRLCDVELESCLVHPFTAKHGAGRVLKVRTVTINLLSARATISLVFFITP